MGFRKKKKISSRLKTEDNVSKFVWSHDGKYFVILYEKETVLPLCRVTKKLTLEVVHTINHKSKITAAIFANVPFSSVTKKEDEESRLIILSASDSVIKGHDVENTKHIWDFVGREGDITALTVIQEKDVPVLLCAGTDKSIKAWVFRDDSKGKNLPLFCKPKVEKKNYHIKYQSVHFAENKIYSIGEENDGLFEIDIKTGNVIKELTSFKFNDNSKVEMKKQNIHY